MRTVLKPEGKALIGIRKKSQKDQIIANFIELGLDGVIFTVSKSGKTLYGQIKKYFRENNNIIK